jgi:glycosyltransferase involved in cell wall biosynthesis
MNASPGRLAPTLWTVPDFHPVLAAVRRAPEPEFPGAVHLVPSLSMGGAERIALDLAGSAAHRGRPLDLVVMREAKVPHAYGPGLGARVERLGSLPWPERLDRAAERILASGLPGFCHLTSMAELQGLWDRGALTVPVVHNARAGWAQDPTGWDPARVPYAVACGEAVARDLAESGCPVPVVVHRHVVPSPDPMDPDRRTALRAAFSAGPGTLLIGMTGRVVPQKRHDRAVAVLAEIVRKGRDARLVVLGHCAPGEDGGAYARAVAAAEALGVRGRVLFVGGVQGAGGIAGAFDLHLNTSEFEGVSIATMEAVAAGVPVVTLAAGGQSEAVGPRDAVLPRDAETSGIACAVLSRLEGSPQDAVPHREAFRHAAVDLWAWTLSFRTRPRPVLSDVLFVTGNMDVGGAQRSLGILAAELARRGRRVAVAVCGPFGVPDFLSAAVGAGVEVLDLAGVPGSVGGPAGRIGRVLGAADVRGPRSVCFWNMDAVTKAGVAKALRGCGIRVVDASPGPALFRELDEAAGQLSMLSTSPESYLSGLDGFAAKYAGGLPAVPVSGGAVIRNGVPIAEPLPDGEGPAPEAGCDPGLAVLVVGRLNATKKIDLLPEVARALRRRVPGATVTAVGGVHGEAPTLQAAEGLRLLPPDTRASGFAGRFACLLMLSNEQGCPNASLEAMSAGIPVVANDDGGTSEQVLDGVTGRLLAPGTDAELAARAVDALAGILADQGLRLSMGRAARLHASQGFDVAAMADGYERLLLEGNSP